VEVDVDGLYQRHSELVDKLFSNDMKLSNEDRAELATVRVNLDLVDGIERLKSERATLAAELHEARREAEAQREIAKMWQDRAEPHKGQPEHDPCERQIAALAAELERVRESLKELRYEVERSPAPGREAMWNIIHAALGPAAEAKEARET